jgi:hypothetical protein
VTSPLPVSKGNAETNENRRTVGIRNFDMPLILREGMTRVADRKDMKYKLSP